MDPRGSRSSRVLSWCYDYSFNKRKDSLEENDPYLLSYQGVVLLADVSREIGRLSWRERGWNGLEHYDLDQI